MILIPEIPYDIDKVCEKIMSRDRAGQNFSIVVAAEGAYPRVRREVAGGTVRPEGDSRRRGRGAACRADPCRDWKGVPVAGAWSPAERWNADGLRPSPRYTLGAAAVRAVENGAWGQMVALQSPHLVTVPIADVIREEKRVEIDHDIVRAARSTGISMGD